MKTKFGVIGVGRWGIHYVRNLLQNPQAQLTTIVDSCEDRLKYCLEQFGLESSGVKVTSQWQNIEADAIVIATPATTHHALIKEVLTAGYHVLSEKPLTLNPGECLELIELAQQRGLILFTDHTYLFNNSVIEGKKVVESDRLGQLRYGYASRTHLGPVRQDVDALWDLAIHDIAIFNYWLGETPAKVKARGESWLQSGLSDLVWATLNYPSGFTVQIHLCWSNPDKQRRLALVGSEATLIFDELSPVSALTLQRGEFNRDGDAFYPINQSTEIIPVPKNEPLKTVCARFLDSITTKNIPVEASGETAAQLVEILHCLSRSLKNGGEEIKVISPIGRY
ncbi:MAG: Inositol 2-dehydrogenase/D-chiro-inositol 3-dehydrogenase [Chroococcopsis gigantea SAG 12.99]|jgi:predicted dehydrogenase|nr:Gfo/Idh/MocA family oxidoreductase [Chlorogloea purpurea SAG 13.99]MDV2999932.1 Inositol 2-dehydrogenase/D-chiro-inositol 3-dehydrogenase [Chroococcopsis gigantea SAG 12.99]